MVITVSSVKKALGDQKGKSLLLILLNSYMDPIMSPIMAP